MRILIIKLGAIGDVIRTTSILPMLKEKYKANITWVTKTDSISLLKNNYNIDNLFSIEDLNKEILNQKYDLVINFEDEKEACDLAINVKKDKLIGAYTKDGKRTYTDNASEWFDMGLISKYGKEKADELKAKNKRTYQDIHFSILGFKHDINHVPQLNLSKEEIEFGKKFAEKNNIKNELIIGINAGAGGRWQDKKLGIKETIELVDKINNKIKNSKLILFGGPEEKEKNDKIKESVKTSIIDAGCGNSLMEFASLVNLCNILVTSDSLAMHIGIALKKKIVAFFYPTSEAEIELYGRGIKITGKGKDYCSYKTECDDPPKWDIDGMVKAVKSLI